MKLKISKKVLNLSIGIVLSVAAIVLLNIYISKERNKMSSDLKRAFAEKYKSLGSVIVAKKDIPPGTEITSDMLETKVVPNKYIQPRAATSANRIVGMKTVVPINKGEQISLSKLLSPRIARGQSLAMATPVGKRAITINVDNIAGLMGMLRPGDYVDVIVLMAVPVRTEGGKQVKQMLTIPLFQNVLVLAVGNKLANIGEAKSSSWRISAKKTKAARASASEGVTLALLPKEASLLSFVSEQGRIRLLMRSPADARIEPIPPANWETFFEYIHPTLPGQPQQAPQQAIETPRRIEIYRGLEKGYITISK
ncbi:MAG: Flp pilus assembly protein CpaB [Candidatus Omnitrophica bacterium 4484_171]|nr:MAG: Flp pilus assembly protein CpaB [Candidatus Omnitrophica bacterium 4484_171]